MSVKRTLVSASVGLFNTNWPRAKPSDTNSVTGQVGKVLGDKWKALSEKQREPYEKKAANDKKRYEDEKAKYNVSINPCPCSPFLFSTDHCQAADDDEDDD